MQFRSRCLRNRLNLIALGLVVLLGLWPHDAMSENQTFPQASPRDLGLTLPKNAEAVVPEKKQFVLIRPKNREPIVAQVYLEVGHYYVVRLPSGRLTSVKQVAVEKTDQPFVPVTKDELAAHLTAKKFKGFKTRSTKRYLYVYNTSDEFATATSRILETMYPGVFTYCKNQGLEVQQAEGPMVVVMFRNQKEFNQYRAMPPGLVAYYNSLSNYIVMYEQSDLMDVAPIVAFKQSVSTIAHEGVHQILHNIGVQKRLSRWPLWISEGLAEFFAPTEVKRRTRWKGVGLVNDLRMYELSEFYRRAPNGTTQGQLIRQTTESGAINSLGYATSWALVNHMAKKRRKDFSSYLKEVSQVGPLESPPPGKLFVKHFGGDFVDIERRLLKQLKSLNYVDPFANQPHFVVILRKGVITTSSPKQVRELREDKRRKVVRVHTFQNRNLAEQFEDRVKRGR